MPKPSQRKAGKGGGKGASQKSAAPSWLSPLNRLAAWLGWRRQDQKRRTTGRQIRPKLVAGLGAKRALAAWKELRRRTTSEAKAHLLEQQPLPAIRKLSRALLDDPQHQPYHDLLAEAVQQRRQRRLKPGRRDPWLDLPDELQKQALQLEAFGAYVQELEHLLEKAGIPPLAAPSHPHQTEEIAPNPSRED